MLSTPGLIGYAAQLVLDKLRVQPGLGFSLRLLSNYYRGKCINVRRSSDNTSVDIGFVNGVLDTATLLAFVGSGSGYVTTLYNQGTLGSSGNAAQATAANQPILCSGGVVNLWNNLPALQFNGSQVMSSPYVYLMGPDGRFMNTFIAAGSSSVATSIGLNFDPPFGTRVGTVFFNPNNNDVSGYYFDSTGALTYLNNTFATGPLSLVSEVADIIGGVNTITQSGPNFSNSVTTIANPYAYKSTQLLLNYNATGTFSEAVFWQDVNYTDLAIYRRDAAHFFNIAGVT